MNPKRIKSNSELQRVANLLKRYYEERPDSYGLMDREQIQYDSYADIVSRWTPISGKILDLGCGTYRTPQLLHQKGFDVVGCDLFDPGKLDEYRHMLNSGGPRLISYDGRNLPFEKDAFDTVSILCVSEHVTDVDHFLMEMNRVLKPNGHIVIVGPNLSGPHRMVLGMICLLTKRKRFWHFFTIRECLWSFIKILYWTVSVWFSRTARFVYIYPLIENGKIFFEQPDDDAVHINHPLSFKKWFQQHGFFLNQYNNRCGDSPLTRLYNKMFPSFATKLQIVAQKSG